MPASRSNAAIVPSVVVARRRRTTARRSRARPASRRSSSSRSRRLAHALDERRDQHLAFAGGDHVGEQRQRLGVDERHRAADHDERVAPVAVGCARRAARRAAASSRRWCSPTRTRPRTRARRSRATGVCDSSVSERRARRQLRLQLLLRRQEHPLAHHVVQLVEEPVDRLEAEARHPDEVGVRERQRDAQTAAVRLPHVADFAGKQSPARARAVPSSS